MLEREKLEREIHQLTQIIAANAFALASKSTPIADRAGLQKQIDDTHHHVGRPIETAKRRLKPGHRGTERPTCASQSISTKRSSRRAHCQQPGQPCSPALKRSNKRTRSLKRSLPFTDHEQRRLQLVRMMRRATGAGGNL